MKLTVKEALQQMMDFDPEIHYIFYGSSKSGSCISNIIPSEIMDGSYRIFHKPVKKTRKMNYAEIRELVIKRAWFKNKNFSGYAMTIQEFNDTGERLNNMTMDHFFDVIKTYSLDGCKTWLPLTVEE